MDLTDLLNSIKEAIRPGSSAIQTAPGQTYGPSVSRNSRVPINFRPLTNDDSGMYEPRFTSMLGQYLPGNHPQIYIDPTSKDFNETYKGNVAPVIQHESAHALLEPKLDDEQYHDIAVNNPVYSNLVNKIADTRNGFMPAEIPAYAAESGAAARYGIPQNIIDLYKQHMQKQLQAIDPGLATAYSRNSGRK